MPPLCRNGTSLIIVTTELNSTARLCKDPRVEPHFSGQRYTCVVARKPPADVDVTVLQGTTFMFLYRAHFHGERSLPRM